MIAQGKKNSYNQSNHQNFDPTLLAKNFWLVYMRMKQLFFEKKSKRPTKKKLISKTAISRKFYGLVLGLIELIDAKGIDVAQL